MLPPLFWHLSGQDLQDGGLLQYSSAWWWDFKNPQKISLGWLCKSMKMVEQGMNSRESVTMAVQMYEHGWERCEPQISPLGWLCRGMRMVEQGKTPENQLGWLCTGMTMAEQGMTHRPQVSQLGWQCRSMKTVEQGMTPKKISEIIWEIDPIWYFFYLPPIPDFHDFWWL